MPSASPKLLNLKQDHLSKIEVFLVKNHYEIKVMIISLTDRLELPNLIHMTTSTIQFKSSYKILLVMSWREIMTS